jgi:hypothetical protein
LALTDKRLAIMKVLQTAVCLAALTALPVTAASAANPGSSGGAASVLGVLAGSIVPNQELDRASARGATIGSLSTSDGVVSANRVGSQSITGTITTSNSINNNSGFTTVFQNSGNNSLFQSNISVNITIAPK